LLKIHEEKSKKSTLIKKSGREDVISNPTLLTLADRESLKELRKKIDRLYFQIKFLMIDWVIFRKHF
jgi:hypothetical protein